MGKLRILMVNDYFEKIGGAEIYMYELTNSLRQKGHTVEIFTSDKTKDNYYRSVEYPTFINYLKRIINPIMYFRFKNKIDEFNPDIIHIHGMFHELSPLILLATKGIKTIMTVHGYELISAILDDDKTKNCKTIPCLGCFRCIGIKGLIYEKIKKIIHKFLMNNIDLYIAPSKYMEHQLKKNGYKNVSQIYNCFQLFNYVPIYNLNRVLFIGRLVKEKGIYLLLEAFSIVIQIAPNFHLTIVGEGPERKNIEKYISKNHLSRCISLTGRLDKSDIKMEYMKSTIVVAPSLFPENLPTVCIEAMSMGRPVIANNNGGFKEMIDNNFNGFLIDIFDTKRLSFQINKLLNYDSKTINNLGITARSRVENLFSYQIHLVRIVSLYSKLLN